MKRVGKRYILDPDVINSRKEAVYTRKQLFFLMDIKGKFCFIRNFIEITAAFECADLHIVDGETPRIFDKRTVLVILTLGELVNFNFLIDSQEGII